MLVLVSKLYQVVAPICKDSLTLHPLLHFVGKKRKEVNAGEFLYLVHRTGVLEEGTFSSYLFIGEDEPDGISVSLEFL